GKGAGISGKEWGEVVGVMGMVEKEQERGDEVVAGLAGVGLNSNRLNMRGRGEKDRVKSSHWQYKFPLPVKVVATARRLEMPLLKVCTAIEEKKKKLPVKDRWQLH
nr:hypothetical protein [Tanacetum cinerariifolium]